MNLHQDNLTFTKDAIYQKWLTAVLDFKREIEPLSTFVTKQMKLAYLKSLKKTGLVETVIPVDINGRCYEVDLLTDRIYLYDEEGKYLPYLMLEGRKRIDSIIGDIDYSLNICGPAFYKHYTRNYKDIYSIFEFLNDYFDKKDIPEWNRIEKIEKVINLIKNYNNVYQSRKLFRSHLFINLFDESNRIIREIYYNEDFFKVTDLYKNILISDESTTNIVTIPKDIFHIIATYLRNLEINEYLSPIINSAENFEKYNNICELSIDEQKKQIKDFLKQIDPEIYKKTYEYRSKEQKQSKKQNKQKGLNQQDWHNLDSNLYDLFYNPSFLNFLLPEDFTIDNNRILVQVSYNVVKCSLKDIENSREDVLKVSVFKDIEVIFSLLNKKNQRYFFSTYLSNIIQGDYRDFDTILRDDKYWKYTKFYHINNTPLFLSRNCFNYENNYYNENEIQRMKLKLINLLNSKKHQFLEYLFSETDKHLNKNKKNLVNNDNQSISDAFLVDCMDIHLVSSGFKIG